MVKNKIDSNLKFKFYIPFIKLLICDDIPYWNLVPNLLFLLRAALL